MDAKNYEEAIKYIRTVGKPDRAILSMILSGTDDAITLAVKSLEDIRKNDVLPLIETITEESFKEESDIFHGRIGEICAKLNYISELLSLASSNTKTAYEKLERLGRKEDV